MLERSIPQYETMRNGVCSIGARFLSPGCNVVDLGCSKGGTILSLAKLADRSVNFLGINISPSMIEAARINFKDVDNVEIENIDITRNLPTLPGTKLVVSTLTIQFTPIECRQDIIQKVYDSLEPGGAFILVEKILGESAFMNALLVD